jgi:hypothetical protein
MKYGLKKLRNAVQIQLYEMKREEDKLMENAKIFEEFNLQIKALQSF